MARIIKTFTVGKFKSAMPSKLSNDFKLEITVFKNIAD